MREHMGLFRGKRIDNKQWAQGCLITPTSEFLQHKAFVAESLYCGAVCDTDHCELMLGGFAEVDPNTVGECTGLKDKNGKLIFEGDVVSVHGDDLPHWMDDGEIREVKYRGRAYTPFNEYDSDCGTYVLARDCEIIGNIHDNKELLKGGEG